MIEQVIGKRLFIDTNILVYAHINNKSAKHAIAGNLLKRIWEYDNIPSISVQVLNELFVSLLKLDVPKMNCQKIVELYLAWSVQEINVQIVNATFQIFHKYKVSYWDALIIAAAIESSSEILLTEDLNDGQKYDTVKVINPFKQKERKQ